MQLRSLSLEGFHCFGDSVEIELDALTTLIGSNGCGKSAALAALTRLFGTSHSVRHIRQSDFHLPSGKTYDDYAELTLKLEVIIDFPELEDDDELDVAVSECFNQMAIEEEGATPYCRIQLRAKWTRTNLSEGEIEETIHWITTADDPTVDDTKTMRPHERSRIHVVYVPAIRDPARQLRQASGTILSRLLRATNWSDGGKKAIEKAATMVGNTFRSEEAVKLIEAESGATWKKLQDFPDLADIHLQPLETTLSELIRQIDVQFGGKPGQRGLDSERLSDGLRSLFYFSLLIASYRLEQQAVTDAEGHEDDDDDEDESPPPFMKEALEPPVLTVFAIEEPENHLAAHYLGRVLSLLKDVSNDHAAQVLLTSHSSSILGRVDPENVRHLRLDANRCAQVRKIKLPKSTDEAFKYVKEAVRAFPELYFARLVILGEGDSEEIVLRHFATLSGLEPDASAIVVVPLGGRHVNHFWTLLTDLDIPHVTLLDLDRERNGGGWGRIQYACEQLELRGVARDKLYTTEVGGKSKIMSPEEVKGIHGWAVSETTVMDGWVDSLTKFSVYFCTPLDLDYMMLSAYEKEYKATASLGPRIPDKSTPKYAERLEKVTTATLKASHSGGNTFSDEEKELFFWYSTLFLGNGKPTTHLMALNAIPAKKLKENCPPVITKLIERAKKKLGIEE